MQELLQSNSIAGSVEESLKAMLSQKMSMTTTTQSMDFGEIFANATKKQKELADFAASMIWKEFILVLKESKRKMKKLIYHYSFTINAYENP